MLHHFPGWDKQATTTTHIYNNTILDTCICYFLQIMIPGTSTCHDHWTVEYSGWLMSSARSTDEQYSTISNQICVARSMETFSAPTNNSTIKLSHVKLDINNIILRTPCVVCSRWFPRTYNIDRPTLASFLVLLHELLFIIFFSIIDFIWPVLCLIRSTIFASYHRPPSHFSNILLWPNG